MTPLLGQLYNAVNVCQQCTAELLHVTTSLLEHAEHLGLCGPYARKHLSSRMTETNGVMYLKLLTQEGSGHLTFVSWVRDYYSKKGLHQIFVNL